MTLINGDVKRKLILTSKNLSNTILFLLTLQKNKNKTILSLPASILLNHPSLLQKNKIEKHTM